MKTITNIIGKLIGWIGVVWIAIWFIPILISAIMIDIYLGVLNVEKEHKCLHWIAKWCSDLSQALKTK